MEKPTLKEFLASLPATKEALAALIKEKGIQGERKSPWSCAIANLCKAEGFEVSVTPYNVRDCLSDPEGTGNHRLYPNSEGMRDFIYAFDGNEYPELDIHSHSRVKVINVG